MLLFFSEKPSEIVIQRVGDAGQDDILASAGIPLNFIVSLFFISLFLFQLNVCLFVISLCYFFLSFSLNVCLCVIFLFLLSVLVSFLFCLNVCLCFVLHQFSSTWSLLFFFWDRFLLGNCLSLLCFLWSFSFCLSLLCFLWSFSFT